MSGSVSRPAGGDAERSSGMAMMCAVKKEDMDSRSAAGEKQ